MTTAKHTLSLDAFDNVYVTVYYVDDKPWFKFVVNHEGRRVTRAVSQKEFFELLYGPEA